MSDYRPMPEWLKKLANETHGFEGHAFPYPYEKQGKLCPRESSSGSPLDGTLIYRSLYHALIWIPGYSYYANSMSGTTSHGMQLKLVRLAFPNEHQFKYGSKVELELYRNEGESRPITKLLFLKLVDKCKALDADWPTAYERAAAEVLRKESEAAAHEEQRKQEQQARDLLAQHGPTLLDAVLELLTADDNSEHRDGVDFCIAMQHVREVYESIRGDLKPLLDPRAENTSP